ncbi:MAG: DUF2087 domain-containing protein [Ilumatobacteraceae bacterium]
MAEIRSLDAGTIVGALADEQRRRAFAALELGATSLDGVVEATGMSPTEAAKALGRLVDIGLVVGGGGGQGGRSGLYVVDAAFERAAREALAKPKSSEHADLPAETRKVMDAFVVDGRLVSIPTTRAKRLVVLDRLSQDFEPGRRYSESMVNLILGKFHPDTAALRRYLVDELFLAREAGQYWRSGGTTA